MFVTEIEGSLRLPMPLDHLKRGGVTVALFVFDRFKLNLPSLGDRGSRIDPLSADDDRNIAIIL